MKTWPTPHNPENMPPPAPGYRYIGRDEPRNLETDEVHSVNWFPLRDSSVSQGPSYWTIRRALNVDDREAPPPEEWSQPGWEVVTDPAALRQEGDEVWWRYHGEAGARWVPVRNGFGEAHCVFGKNPYYFRRRTTYAGGAVTTLSQSTPVNTASPQVSSSTDVPALKPGQTIAVHVHGNHIFGRAVQGIAFERGFHWNNSESREYRNLDAGVLLLYTSDGDLTYGTNISIKNTYLVLDARTDLGRLIDLLADWKKPLDAPKVNGYKASYTKGDKVVKFGCAEISTSMIGFINTLMTTPRPGNRTVEAVVLSSGVKLTRDDIKGVLIYVEAVEKAPYIEAS